MIKYLRPLHDGIVLKRLEKPQISAILVPEIAMTAQHRGEVVSVGPGKRDEKGRRRPVDVTPGEIVVYQSCDRDEGDYVLIREGDILFKENA